MVISDFKVFIVFVALGLPFPHSQVAYGQNIEKSRQSGQKCEIFFGHSLGGMI